MLFSLLALGLGAQGVTTADRDDGRCAASMSMTADSMTGDDKVALEAGMMFYLGRIAGRSGETAVAPALEAGAEALLEGDPATIVEGCADALEAITKGM